MAAVLVPECRAAAPDGAPDGASNGASDGAALH
jgi:hypothetical protein